MESNFNNRDFERFVKQNADQYRMFPTEKVWKGVHKALHTRRRWYGIGLFLLFITTAVVTIVMLSPGSKDENLVTTSVKAIPVKETAASSQQPVDIATTVAVSARQKKSPFITSPEDLQQGSLMVTVLDLADNNNNSTGEMQDKGTEPVLDLASLSASNPERTRTTQIQNRPAGNNNSSLAPAVVPAPVFLSDNNSIAKAEKQADPDNVNSKKPDDQEDTKLPLIPERSARSITKISKKKLGWQLYFTPTISYRSLTENTAFLTAARYNSIVNSTGGGALYSSDVNTMVNHKPDLGFQIGVRTAYPVSKWFSLTGGFQLSVSKYDIKAYDHPAEMATITLTDRSVSTVSSLRNTNGYKENWLRNFYFSASVPIGMELKLSDGDKNYFGVAGTIQPTYVLDNRSYLISADYKNYAEMPSLTRRWNMNSSFEVFSAHTTGKLKWRVGPQIRYQAMSSFVKNYPIKEHLFDFGLKLGIQLK